MTVMTSEQEPATTPETAPLPPGWAWTTLGEVLLPVHKVDRSKAHGDFTYIDIASIDNTRQLIASPQRISWSDAPSRAQQLIQSGDTVFSTVRTYLKNIALVPEHLDGEIASTGFCVLRPSSGVEAAFVYRLAQSRGFLGSLGRIQRGTSYPAVRDSDVKEQPIMLPPLPEQQRIVTRIEELFSKLDAGVAGLKRTQTLLKRYRQSLLHAAVTGELSREWRKENGSGNSNSETAQRLLERLLAERRERWVQSGKKGKYKEPQAPNVEGLPQLPEGWTWASVEQVISCPIGNGLSVRGSDEPPGVAALKLSAMSNNGFDFGKVRYLPVEPSDVDDLFVKLGDFFVSRGNGTLRLVGRGTVAQAPPFPVIFPDTMMRLRFLPPLTEWVNTIWPGTFVRRQIEVGAKTTAGIWKISQPQLAHVLIPLPPLPEQSYIVAEVERRLSVLDNMEATVAAELKRAEATRQSILHQAFTGGLVAQDAADEPASVLLERIQAEKVQAGAQAMRAGRRRGRRAQG